MNSLPDELWAEVIAFVQSHGLCGLCRCWYRLSHHRYLKVRAEDSDQMLPSEEDLRRLFCLLNPHLRVSLKGIPSAAIVSFLDSLPADVRMTSLQVESNAYSKEVCESLERLGRLCLTKEVVLRFRPVRFATATFLPNPKKSFRGLRVLELGFKSWLWLGLDDRHIENLAQGLSDLSLSSLHFDLGYNEGITSRVVSFLLQVCVQPSLEALEVSLIACNGLTAEVFWPLATWPPLCPKLRLLKLSFEWLKVGDEGAGLVLDMCSVVGPRLKELWLDLKECGLTDTSAPRVEALVSGLRPDLKGLISLSFNSFSKEVQCLLKRLPFVCPFF